MHRIQCMHQIERVNDMKEITISAYDSNVFDAIGKQWMLISAKNATGVNTMTASWGGFGVLWKRDVATIYVRPQRYTKEFIDQSDYFSLCFFDESWKKQLSYLGSVSGRDEPKIQRAGLTICDQDVAPYFAEASCVMLCRKLYAQELKKECFLDPAVYEQNYPLNDLHTMYIGEIVKMYVKE